MTAYEILATLGGLGLLAMGLGGFGHGHMGHHHAHAGHHGHAGHGGIKNTLSAALTSLLSPMMFFSFVMGVGVTGMVTSSFGVWRPLVALLGGIVVTFAIVRPLWDFLFRFASAPAQTLDMAVAEPCTAVTAFNHEGDGLIRLALDGQERQILASLRPDERGSTVRQGDKLLIEAIDAKRNRCTVSLWQKPQPAAKDTTPGTLPLE